MAGAHPPIDFNGDGAEAVTLDGSGSHSHFFGAATSAAGRIVKYAWTHGSSGYSRSLKNPALQLLQELQTGLDDPLRAEADVEDSLPQHMSARIYERTAAAVGHRSHPHLHLFHLCHARTCNPGFGIAVWVRRWGLRLLRVGGSTDGAWGGGGSAAPAPTTKARGRAPR